MIIQRYTPQNTALSLLQSAGSSVVSAQAQSQKKSSQEDSILAALEKVDPAKAQKFKQEQALLKQTIEQLQSLKSKDSGEKKEAARQKIEQLKAQIQALRLMAATDPKAAARQAARLARELAAAAKDYADAGGGAASTVVAGGGAATTASTTAVAATGAATNVPTATEGASSVVSGETVAPVVSANTEQVQAASTDAASAGAEAGSVPSDTAADASGAGAGTLTTNGTDAETTTPADQADKDRAALRDTINAKLSEINKRIGEADGDRKFAAQVRHLMNQLKMIIQSAKEKLQAEGKGEGDPDISSAEKSFRDIDKSLGTIESGATATSVGVMAEATPGAGDVSVSAPVSVNIIA